MSKVLVIGLDGATLDLIEPWAQAGHLPNLATLMQGGRYGRLQSVLPTLSSAAWPSFMTGTNPGKHSLIDFVRREQGSYRLRVLTYDHMIGSSLWQLLSQQDKKVCVMNVPMTYPPREVNGFLVTGLGTPDYKTFTYPESLSTQLLERGYQVNKREAYHPGDEASYLQEIYQVTEKVAESAQWLMHQQAWDFFMVVFFDTDQIGHYFWKHMDVTHPAHQVVSDAPYVHTIQEYYQKIDSYVGELVRQAGPETTVLVMSDHGMGPLYRDVLLNEWLRQNGYLVTQSDAATKTEFRHILSQLGLTRANVSATLRRIGLRRFERWLREALGDRIEWLPRTGRADFPEAIEWTRTQAYSFGYQGQIYINLRGREPNGIVEPGSDYDHLCREITSKLRQLVDPKDGLPVVDRIFLQEEAFGKSSGAFAPDILLVMRNLSYMTRKGYEFGADKGEIFTDPITYESGSHRQDGMVIMYGDKIRGGGLVDNDAKLIDLAPTILHLLGCSIPNRMDGVVLENWLLSDLIANYVDDYENLGHQFTPKSLSDDEEKEILERLKGLGYLE